MAVRHTGRLMMPEGYGVVDSGPMLEGDWSGEGAGGLHVLAPVSALAWSRFPRDVTRFEFD
jgi:hypothetical protein